MRGRVEPLIRRSLLVDASAWVALLDGRDRCHPAARELWRTCLESRRSFVTSDYILDEAYTLLRRRRNGLRMAMALHDLLGRSRLVEVAQIELQLRSMAWELFVTYDDQVLSFTDCTSFAVMREHGLSRVFTFDGDFHKVGFVALPER